MEHIFGQEWEIVPAGGATGKAFFAQHEEQKLFLKRNSSPFLAVLSAEGLVPKLVWTKRLETGDVITAQQWLNGRELTPTEMNHEKVAKLLRKIHQSEPLKGMLSRLGKAPLNPEPFFQKVQDGLDQELMQIPSVKKSTEFLAMEVHKVECDQFVVCHGDVNHNNWLLGNNNQLYLIDWDGAMIGDPAIDLGLLLYWYIPKKEWQKWLELYGIQVTDHLKLRMKWYVLAHTLSSIQWHKRKARFPEMKRWIEYLDKIL
ncbi:MAG: phosphotransferase, choline kinase family enzyme [Bacillus sp. (in: firmicutes)]|uniref:phosphotransferase family protein n=1 Tax=Bacillus sp. 1NLA3E TaxID=666686 RepID=UPI000247E599|nr:phosphotransferase family protein [Bacillus sp. 1NLA3E]AGK55246.1 phosphotransferase, choline kinase family enzyme [Bacillus sp. 1NLA3E]MDF2903334.1 phosphotransferase, choline kinase family enzyme [Bacillus sp. (in: firmicutes)]